MDILHKALTFKPRQVVPPFSWVGHIPFAAMLVAETKPELIVELGTHTGNSYFTFCQAVQENGLTTKCYAVDTWQGEAHAGHYDETVFNNVNTYNQENYSDFSYLLRTTFDEASKKFSDNSIDLLHIDGLHTYEAVKQDCDTWLPKVKDGGVVLFHDISCRHADFGVWKLWEEIQASNYCTVTFCHCHGLGVLIKNPVGDINYFIKYITSKDHTESVRSIFSSLGSKILTLAEFKLEITQRDASISALTSTLERCEACITDLQNDLKFKLNKISRMQNSFSWKITSPLRAIRRVILRLFCDFM